MYRELCLKCNSPKTSSPTYLSPYTIFECGSRIDCSWKFYQSDNCMRRQITRLESALREIATLAVQDTKTTVGQVCQQIEVIARMAIR